MPSSSQPLADRIRQKLLPVTHFDEKKMFGGIGFMVNGNMTVGAHKEVLIARVGVEQHKIALSMKGAKPFDMTGKPMKGWVMISEEGYATEKQLETWISLAMEFVKTLPSK